MSYIVTEIIDGDTFTVRPAWKFGKEEGNRVRPVGFDAPEKGSRGSAAATERLRSLIYGKAVDLHKPVGLDRGRLLCTVLFNGKDIATILG